MQRLERGSISTSIGPWNELERQHINNVKLEENKDDEVQAGWA
jgi:hypothetical protein